MHQSRLSRRPSIAAPLPSLAACIFAALGSGCAGEAPAAAVNSDDAAGDVGSATTADGSAADGGSATAADGVAVDGGGAAAADGAGAELLDSQATGPEVADAGPDIPESDGGQGQADSSPSDNSPSDSASSDATADSVDALAITPWGAAQCATGGPAVGFAVGQRLGDLPIQDCDTGEVRSISEVCGAKAAWIFVAHSHCPTCIATADYSSEVAAAVQSKDVAVVHIVHIDTATTCAAWRKKYALEGLSNVRVYADKSGAAWAALKLQNYTAIHAFTDAGQVVRHKAHGLSSSQVTKQIDAALKP